MIITKTIFQDDFCVKVELTEDEKKDTLTNFSNNFTQAHQLMAWLEDPNVKLDERVPYFDHMTHIFNSMTFTLNLLLKADVSKKEIIEALNDLPF